jgi:RNA polymerase sigma-70 factor (ECF subfamily)
MEIFEIILKDLQKYEVHNLKSWLLSVVKHYCQRKKEKIARLSEKNMALKKNLDFFMEYDRESPLYEIEASHEAYQEMENKLAQAINTLKKEQKTCIELFYMHNKSYQEISNETGFSVKNVKSYIQNGKRNIKILLESETNA